MDWQTETDLFVRGAYSSRQADSSHFRLWEVPGTAHADTYITGDGFTDEGDDVSTATPRETDKPGPIGPCPEPLNSAPQHHFVAGAANRALNQCRVDVTAPPAPPRRRINAAAAALQRAPPRNAPRGA